MTGAGGVGVSRPAVLRGGRQLSLLQVAEDSGLRVTPPHIAPVQRQPAAGALLGIASQLVPLDYLNEMDSHTPVKL